MTDHILTLKEAAEGLSIHYKTLQKWIAMGRGPPLVKLSRRKIGVRNSDLQAYIEHYVTRPDEEPSGR
jgi:excisionase family DNA binding protein